MDTDPKALADAALTDIGSRYNRRAFEGEVSDVLTYLAEDADPDMDAAMQTLTETCRAAAHAMNRHMMYITVYTTGSFFMVFMVGI